MTDLAIQENRAELHGWDDDPRGHDYQVAQFHWCMGYRRAWLLTHKWKQRLLTKHGRLVGRRYRQKEIYLTLREFRAFLNIEAEQ